MTSGNAPFRDARARRVLLVAGLVSALVLTGTGTAAAGSPGGESPDTPIPVPSPIPEEGIPAEPGLPTEERTAEVVVAADDVVLELSGTLIVTYVDHAVEPSQLSEYREPELSVAVAVDGGVLQLTGEVPADVRSGDAFEGTVVVPAAVLDELPGEVVEGLESGESVDPSSDAGQEIIETASASSTALPVAESDIVTANGTVGTPGAHQVRFARLTLTGKPNNYTEPETAALGTFATNYWLDESNGLVSAFSMVTTLAFSRTHACPIQTGSATYFTVWQDALTQMGLGNINTFLAGNSGIHVAVLLPEACENTSGIGIGTVGSGLHSNGLTMSTVDSGIDRTTLIHEIGHNMGLGHSNVGICDDDATAIGCAEYEYGDFYDVMGIGIGGFDTATELNVRAQYELGFVDDTDVPLIALPGGDPDESFTIELSGMSGDSTDNPIGYRVVDPISGDLFFLEYRDGEPGAFYSDQNVIDNLGFEYEEGWVLSERGSRFVGEGSNGGSMALTHLGFGGDPGLDDYYFMAFGEDGPFTTPSGGIEATQDLCLDVSCDDIQITLHLQTGPAGVTQSVFRFWSDTFQSHFYTMSVQERDYVINNYPDYIWKYEKVAYSAYSTQEPGTVPLFRFWSDVYNGHFYTANPNERDYVINTYPDNVWKYEKIAYYVYPADNSVPNTIGVFRFWSNTKGHHFYTANPVERDIVINVYPDDVWKYERKAFEVPNS